MRAARSVLDIANTPLLPPKHIRTIHTRPQIHRLLTSLRASMLALIPTAVALNLFALAPSLVTATQVQSDVHQIRYIFFDIPGTDGSADAFIAGTSCPEPMLPENKQGTAVDRSNPANSIQMYSYMAYGRQCTSYYASGGQDWFSKSVSSAPELQQEALTAPVIATMAECVDPDTQVEDPIEVTFVCGWLPIATHWRVCATAADTDASHLVPGPAAQVPIEYGAPYACPDNCEETCNRLSPTGNWVENAKIIRLIEWSIVAPATSMVRRSRRAKAISS